MSIRATSLSILYMASRAALLSVLALGLLIYVQVPEFVMRTKLK